MRIFSNGLKLRYGDGRSIKPGAIHDARHNGRRIKATPHLCVYGMHASLTPYMALRSVPCGPDNVSVVSYVMIGGVTSNDIKKFVGSVRQYLRVHKLSIQERIAIASKYRVILTLEPMVANPSYGPAILATINAETLALDTFVKKILGISL